MYKFLIASALAGVAAHASAQTGRIVDETAASFAGFKVGVDIGYQHDEQRFRLTNNQGISGFDFRGDGFTYGGRVGFDAALGRKVIVGAEASVSGATGDITVRDSGFEVTTGFSRGRRIEGSARIGAVVAPRWLAYARAGYANQQYDVSGGAGARFGEFEGIVFGGGVEYALTRRIAARVEYTRTEYDSKRSRFFDGETSFAASLKPVTDRALVGVTYRFGR